MRTLCVGQIAKWVKPLTPTDTLSRAIHLMRTTGVTALPIAQEGHIIGFVREEDLVKALSTSPFLAPEWSVSSLMTEDFTQVDPSTPLEEALKIVSSNGTSVLGVVDEGGNYRGLVTRGDLIGAWTHRLRPARIGGMATPLGVYLFAGGVRGGVGDLALFLTGAVLSALVWGSLVLIYLIATWVENSGGPPLRALMESPPTGIGLWMDQIHFFLTGVIPFVMMMAFLRFSPLAGYHAAEHQTVWAIEEGEPLKPEFVARMPRPHPRCGTNLMVIFLLFWVLHRFNPILAFIVSLVTWRFFGYYLQLYVTTKPATYQQIQSGIKAGEELLERYSADPHSAESVGIGVRLWNMGWAQVVLGWFSVYLLFYLLFPSLGDLL